MVACLGLDRSQPNINKQQHKDLKLQDQHQQQHTKMQQQKQQKQAIITNQNYYTRQKQPQNQRHLVARGQTTNVGELKTEFQQQQYNEESHLVKQQRQQKNVQHNATPISCTTTPKYRNTAPSPTTTANMQQPSISTANDNAGGVGRAVQQQPQTISFQKNTVTVEVTPTLPSTVSPTKTPGIATNANVKTFRKINRQPQQQQEQLEADLDTIEVCVDPEPPVSFEGGGGLLRQAKTLGRFTHQHQQHHSIEDQHGQWTNKSQATSFQLLQLQQQQQHDYSYAYYEPGAVMRHTNIPHAELVLGENEEEDLIPPAPNSIRALLLKGKKNKLLVSPTTRQSYQTRLTQQQIHNADGAMTSANISTPENYYEEISASSTSSSSNSMTGPHQRRASSHSSVALNQTLVEEELRRVQNIHHKILGELNLSVEAMLIPESPPNRSPTDKEPSTPAVSVTTASGQPLRLTSSSADNLCETALTKGPADNFISPIPNAATISAGLLQSSCVAADFDSGFSGSSGASYVGSLRLHKTKALMSSRSNNLSSTITTAAGSNAAAKSQQSAFAYATQCCSFQRANSKTTDAGSSSAEVQASATTSSCTIKHLPQIHHNTKQQQQQLHLQHQRHQHDHSHLHHYHPHHLHQQQQHPYQQQQPSQHVNDDLHNSSGFFARASCGCRILNCAKIRVAEDPGPVVLNMQPKESKARSFWNRKGWRKLPGFSTSTSIINDPG